MIQIFQLIAGSASGLFQLIAGSASGQVSVGCSMKGIDHVPVVLKNEIQERHRVLKHKGCLRTEPSFIKTFVVIFYQDICKWRAKESFVSESRTEPSFTKTFVAIFYQDICKWRAKESFVSESSGRPFHCTSQTLELWTCVVHPAWAKSFPLNHRSYYPIGGAASTHCASCHIPWRGKSLEEIKKSSDFIFCLLVKAYPLTYFCFESSTKEKVKEMKMNFAYHIVLFWYLK